MSSAPADLLTVARELSKCSSEAHWRGAVSRAYYASYHACLRWHDTLPMPGDPGSARGEHERLIQRLVNPAKQCAASEVRTSRWLSGQLSNLRAMRVQSDYELANTVALEDAVLACGLSAATLSLTVS